MFRTMCKHIAGVLLVSLLFACGGGGSGPSDNSGIVPVLSLASSPTAVLRATVSSARALASEISTAADLIGRLDGTPLLFPPGIDWLAHNAVNTFNCAQYLGGVSGTLSLDSNIPSPPIPGSFANVTFGACEFTMDGVDYVYDGTLRVEVVRYVDGGDYSIRVSGNDFRVAINGRTSHESFSVVIDHTGGVDHVVFTTSDGAAIAFDLPDVTRTGTIVTINGASFVYQSSSGQGIARIVFDHFSFDSATGRPISGSVTVFGANQTSVTIIAGPNAYTLQYTDATGLKISLTITYG